MALIGVACYGVFTFACAFALFGALKPTMGIRVSEVEELEGLHLGEHGMHAYDLALGPGWLEPQPGIPLRPAPAAAPTLATSENA